MNVFALYRGRNFTSVFKQIAVLRDLIWLNSFHKQVVVYLVSCHSSASGKDELWGEWVESCGQSRFCCSCCQKGSHGWVSYYWECLSSSSSYHHLWMVSTRSTLRSGSEPLGSAMGSNSCFPSSPEKGKGKTGRPAVIPLWRPRCCSWKCQVCLCLKLAFGYLHLNSQLG